MNADGELVHRGLRAVVERWTLTHRPGSPSAASVAGSSSSQSTAPSARGNPSIAMQLAEMRAKQAYEEEAARQRSAAYAAEVKRLETLQLYGQFQ